MYDLNNLKDWKFLLFLSVIIISMDFLWLKYGVSELWKTNVKSVQKSEMKINIQYALLSYILIIFGIYYFVQRHISKENYVYESLLNGFLFGFILYGVFDFTNLSIFKEFDLKTSIIDMIWGGTLTASALVITNKLIL